MVSCFSADSRDFCFSSVDTGTGVGCLLRQLWFCVVTLWGGRAGQLCIHTGQLCVHAGQLCIYAGQLCLHAGQLCLHADQLFKRAGQYCLHIGQLCLRSGAVHFNDLAHLGHIHELVDQTLTVNLGQNAALIIIPVKSFILEFNIQKRYQANDLPQSPAHGFVVHVRLVLVQSPQPRDGLGVDQLEDALLPVGPLDVPRAALLVLKQLEQELPEVRRGTLAAFAFQRNAVGTKFGFSRKKSTH